MDSPALEIDAAGIVLVGAFNPPIFQPSWLASRGLIRDKEAEGAVVGVIHPDISAFTADWLNLQVTKDRFVVETADAAHYTALRDLVVAVFGVLEHTPFNKLGMNRLMHFRMPSIDKWHAFGHMIAPKGPWGDVLGTNPGMRSLVLESEATTHEAFTEQTFVRVEPSIRVSPGVYIEVNKHQETTGEDSSRRLLLRMAEQWDDTQSHAKSIADHLLNENY